jgi:hypothetical protein
LLHRAAAPFLLGCIARLGLCLSLGDDSMTPHALNPCFERVVRAGEHLADLRHRLLAALRKQEDSVICYFDPNPPYVLKTTTPDFPLPPMRIGVLIGEVCYNLRSALDYFVFEIFKLDSGIAQDFTQFPIIDTKDKFRSWAKDARRKGLNSLHIAELKPLQPYNGCNWTKILRDLSNMDKHRQFVNIEGSFTALAFARGEPRFDRLSSPVRRTPHPLHGEMDVKVDITSEILFVDRIPIVEKLEIVKLGVAETLEAFKSDFA